MPSSSAGRNPEPVDPAPGDDAARLRAMTRAWAYRLAGTVYVPTTPEELVQQLAGVADDVVAVVLTGDADLDRAARAGKRLLDLNCTSAEALRLSLEALGRGVAGLAAVRAADRPAERVATALAALCGGYLDAARTAVFEQQERTKLALLKAFRDAKGSLALSEARFETVAGSSPSGIAVTDLDGRFERVNAAFAAIVGLGEAELAGRALFEFVQPDTAEQLRAEYTALAAGEVERVKQVLRLSRADEDTAWITLTANVLPGNMPGEDERTAHFVTVVEDSTEVMLLQSELSRQALHDVLTGLPNRQFFTTQVETSLRRADPDLGVTLYRVDIDAFAVVRDGLGHSVAENVLRAVADRLTALFSDEQATVARLGTVEFAVLVVNSPATPEPVAAVAAIGETMAEPHFVDGHGIGLSVSTGIVHRPARGSDPVSLLGAADLALRRAKAGGHGQWELWHPEAAESDRRRFALAAAMPGAWEDGEIEVVYRPVAALLGAARADGPGGNGLETGVGGIVAVEAQLRWEHPEHGRLDHRRCVELAEDTGLVHRLGQWLLARGCAQVHWWRRQLGRDLRLAVELDADQARDADLVLRVVAALTESGLPADALEVGFPARALTDARAARESLRVLADRGARTAVRGFGMAAGDVAALIDLSVDAAWLSPTLVRQRAEADHASPVLTALTTLGAALREQGITVVADGVHTPAHAAWWHRGGADLVAGRAAGVPVTQDRMATLLAAR
ncbi:putative bifunctional diguanylate cyclase/phosphodiesterase [Actinokineospora guangxiensis]|uniref:Bifunctional diguanylate cyclase/phosphodiesterase n=1 Tax=Actinokineospora guangxiensis TaxID=1490288 RepID=A0ABW0EUE8_9PSEU